MENNIDKETENTSIGITFPITKRALTSWQTYAWITAQCLIIAACSLFETNHLQQSLISVLLASTISMLAIMFIYDFTSDDNVTKTAIYIHSIGIKETDKILAINKSEVKELLSKIKEQPSKEASHES